MMTSILSFFLDADPSCWSFAWVSAIVGYLPAVIDELAKEMGITYKYYVLISGFEAQRQGFQLLDEGTIDAFVSDTTYLTWYHVCSPLVLSYFAHEIFTLQDE